MFRSTPSSCSRASRSAALPATSPADSHPHSPTCRATTRSSPRTVADLVARAGSAGPVSVEALEHARLLLELGRVERAIRRARGAGSSGISDLAREREAGARADPRGRPGAWSARFDGVVTVPQRKITRFPGLSVRLLLRTYVRPCNHRDRIDDGEGIDLNLLLGQGLSSRRSPSDSARPRPRSRYWMASPSGSRPSTARITPRSGETSTASGLEALVEDGQTSRCRWPRTSASARRTVRHWLRPIRTEDRSNVGAMLRAREAEKRRARHASRCSCAEHGETDFILEGRGYYRCKQCRMDRVAGVAAEVKEILVADAGGRCRCCGYDRHLGALEFHHSIRTRSGWRSR